MMAYGNAAYWWAIHHDETHDSDDEYIGKTALSKHAFQMAELCEEAGLWDERDEESEYPDYPSDDEEDWDPPHDYYDDYNPNDDDYYPDDYDPDGPHGPSGGSGGYDGPSDEYDGPDEPDYDEWYNFEQFLEERYGSATDTQNLKLFYMELSDERNFRNVHMYHMSWVHDELITRHVLKQTEPVEVINIIPFQSVQPQKDNQNETSKVSVPCKVVYSFAPKTIEYGSHCSSDKSTDVDENYDNSNYNHHYDCDYEHDHDSDLTEKYSPIVSKKPKTPSKSLRMRARNFRKADFSNIVNNNVFALPIFVD